MPNTFLPLLPYCHQPVEIEEAIVRASYTLAPGACRWMGWVKTVVKHRWTAPVKLWAEWQERQNEIAQVEAFLRQNHIELLCQAHDRPSGIELLAYLWRNEVFVVATGSNDPIDWWRNITERELCIEPFLKNTSLFSSVIMGAITECHHRSGSTPRVTIAGHSRGAVYAQLAAVTWWSISRCVTFQSAALSSTWIQKAHSRNLLECEHWLHRSDPVYPVSRRRSGGGLLPGTVHRVGTKTRGLFRTQQRVQAHLAQLTTLPSTSETIGA